MQDEIRVNPEGTIVAIRNLKHPERADLTWRGTNGGFFTDQQTEGWISLNRSHYIHLVKRGEYEDAYTVAAFSDKEDAEKHIENAMRYSGDRTDIGETTLFYPHGSKE